MLCGETALTFEADSPKGWPDMPRRAAEWGGYPGDELGGGSDPPLSMHLIFTNTAAPSFSELKPGFNHWTRDVRYCAEGVDVSSVWVSDPPECFPFGELDTENSVLGARGYSRESVHMHTLK